MSLAFGLEDFQSELFRITVVYIYQKLKISYNIFDLPHVSKVAAHFQKKNKMLIYLFKYPNEESGKKLKNDNGAFVHYRCLIWF